MTVILDTDTAANLVTVLEQLEDFWRHASDDAVGEWAEFTGHTHDAGRHLAWLVDYLGHTAVTLNVARQAVTT